MFKKPPAWSREESSQEHMGQLEKEITAIVEQTRDGQIVHSLGIGPIQAATILAAIGSIDNFPNAGSLKSYFGWSPTVIQSGSALDSVGQTRGGTRTMKQVMFLIVSNLIQREMTQSAIAATERGIMNR